MTTEQAAELILVLQRINLNLWTTGISIGIISVIMAFSLTIVVWKKKP